MTMTTLIQDEQKRQKIMARMREHLVPVLEHCRGGWVGLFLQGSQNYNLDYESSDHVAQFFRFRVERQTSQHYPHYGE